MTPGRKPLSWFAISFGSDADGSSRGPRRMVVIAREVQASASQARDPNDPPLHATATVESFYSMDRDSVWASVLGVVLCLIIDI